MAVDQGEIEHVHNFSKQKGSISAARWEKGCHLTVAFIEDQSVKGTVDQVSGGTGQNKRKTDNNSEWHLSFPEFGEVPSKGSDGSYSENR